MWIDTISTNRLVTCPCRGEPMHFARTVPQGWRDVPEMQTHLSADNAAFWLRQSKRSALWKVALWKWCRCRPQTAKLSAAERMADTACGAEYRH
jgi:hypothetical protein